MEDIQITLRDRLIEYISLMQNITNIFDLCTQLENEDF